MTRPKIFSPAPDEWKPGKKHWLIGTAIAACGLLVAVLSFAVHLDDGGATTPISQPSGAAPSSQASSPANACRQKINLDEPSGWGPARTIPDDDEFVEWPAINQDDVGPQGDERDFYHGAESSATQDKGMVDAPVSGEWRNEIKVERDKRYLMVIYVHNSANELPENALKNTRVKVSLPQCNGVQSFSNAFVTADNAEPKEVWDGVTFYADEIFNLVYIPGSARMCNNYFTCREDAQKKGTPLTDSLFSQPGQQIGYDSLDGTLLGNYKQDVYVYFGLRPQFCAKVACRP